MIILKNSTLRNIRGNISLNSFYDSLEGNPLLKGRFTYQWEQLYKFFYHTRMVWIFVPYAYSCTILLLFTSSIYIAITNTVLLFVLDHTAFCSDALCGLMHSDKLIISGLANNPHLACCESHWNYCYTQLTII